MPGALVVLPSLQAYSQVGAFGLEPMGMQTCMSPQSFVYMHAPCSGDGLGLGSVQVESPSCDGWHSALPAHAFAVKSVHAGSKEHM